MNRGHSPSICAGDFRGKALTISCIKDALHVRQWMPTLALLLGLCLLAGCAATTISKVDSGQHRLGERLTVNVDGPWNHLRGLGTGSSQTWTVDGLPVDRLQILYGIKDGQAIHGEGAFRSAMRPDDVVAVFASMLTRDGSTVELARLEPFSFGDTGFRFEYSLTRKFDNLRFSGVGYVGISKGELFAILYQAPRLMFARHQQRVEQIAQSARLK
jgi:hypothetical protein